MKENKKNEAPQLWASLNPAKPITIARKSENRPLDAFVFVQMKNEPYIYVAQKLPEAEQLLRAGRRALEISAEQIAKRLREDMGGGA